MPAKLNIIGEQYGRLIVRKEVTPHITPKGIKCRKYLCDCSCGNTTEVRSSDLRSGRTQSCGCLQKEKAHQAKFKHGRRKATDKTYCSWADMKRRCDNPKDANYHNYGGRGITYCQEWANFTNFLADMGECPEGLTLDRINVDGNYEPANCRWADDVTQANNRRNNHLLTYQGKTQTMSQWARELGFTVQLIKDRINRYGWSVEEALSTPVLAPGQYIKKRASICDIRAAA